jgi:uncharacterized protein (TIGR00297 family)
MLNSLLPYGWGSTPERLIAAIVVTAGFELTARVLRGVSRSGMIAGGVSCFLIFVAAGPSAFATLVALFLATWATTKVGYRQKQQLGLAERGDGRNALQVLANLAVPAACAVGYGAFGLRIWLVAMTAALAEAATDTVASEVGQSQGGTAILITTWKAVPAGTDGGITMVGTLAGMGAGIAIALVAAGTMLMIYRQIWIAVTAGIFGMLVDSILGATLQRRGWLSNEAVNLAGTMVAAVIVFSIQHSAFSR